MVKQFQGAIIAAGHGERLRKSAGAELPKPLVEIGGEPMIVRQARLMLAAGASSVVAVINSETARMADQMRLRIPPGLRLVVRDTANSLESLLALGGELERSRFLLATVDSMVAEREFSGFADHAIAMTTSEAEDGFEGVLAVIKWRGDKRPLFTSVTSAGLITALGDRETPLVTAGIYWLPPRVFDFAEPARAASLDALRRFLAMLVQGGVRLGTIELGEAIDVDEAVDLEAARATVLRSVR